MLDKNGHRLILILIAAVECWGIFRVFAISCLSDWREPDIIMQLRLLGGHLPTFLLGYYLGNMRRRVHNGILIGVTLILFAFIALGTYWRTVQIGAYDTVFQSQSAGFEVILAACLFLIAKQNLDRPARFLRRIAIVPLFETVYLIHALIIFLLSIGPLSFPYIVGATALNFVASCLISKTLCSIPALCYPFTGIRYKDAKETCSWGATIRNFRQKNE